MNQQILDEEARNQEWQKQQREEEFAQRLQQAISAREAQGKAITPNALLKITRMSKTEARNDVSQNTWFLHTFGDARH